MIYIDDPKLRIAESGVSFKSKWTIHGRTIGKINFNTGRNKVSLNYATRIKKGDWVNQIYDISLQTTPCHYGGERYWFTCPASNCGRRVALLYLCGHYFACRKCYKLAYPSQRETEWDRAARQADKIREKLHWEPGILNGKGSKPKGMHGKTYERLQAEHDAYVNQSLGAMNIYT